MSKLHKEILHALLDSNYTSKPKTSPLKVYIIVNVTMIVNVVTSNDGNLYINRILYDVFDDKTN